MAIGLKTVGVTRHCPILPTSPTKKKKEIFFCFFFFCFFFCGDAQKKLVKTVAGGACKRLELTRPCISVKYLPMEIVLPIAPLHQSGGVYIIETRKSK